MSKKTSTAFLIMLVITLFSVFAATQVVAQDLPLSCTGGKFTMTAASDNFPEWVAAGGICGSQAGWAWKYDVTVDNPKDMNSITAFFFYAPSDGLNDIPVIDNELVNVYGRGEGALNTTFGEGITNGITWAATSWAGTGATITVTFCTGSNFVGLVSPAFSLSRSILGCESEMNGVPTGIKGPAVTPLIPVSAGFSETWTLTEGDKTCTGTIVFDGVDSTVTVDSGPCSADDLKISEVKFDGKYLDENIIQQRTWIGAHSSPICYYYVIGGDLKKICFGE